MLLKKKPLNPNAPEWTPRPLPLPLRFLPHILFHPHPPTTLPPPPPPPPPPVHAAPPANTSSTRLLSSPPPPHLERNGTRKAALPPRRRRAEAASKRPPSLPPRWRRKTVMPSSRNADDRRGATQLQKPVLPSPSSDDDAFTTVMIKNIPNKIRRDFMLQFLDGYCKNYKLEYDFLYLPMDFRLMNNLGYAFVNFTSGDSARKFKRILNNYKWKGNKEITSRKICEITWARLQGKEAMVKRFSNSNFSCSSLEFLPIVLEPPRNGLDPNPAPPLIVGRIRYPPAND